MKALLLKDFIVIDLITLLQYMQLRFGIAYTKNIYFFA